MNTQTTAWKQEKTRYRKRLDVAMAIAILLMFCLFGFSEPIHLQRITLDQSVIQIVHIPPEIVIPPPD